MVGCTRIRGRRAQPGHKHGGKYLARSGHVKTLEGNPLDTTLIAVMAFPSEAAAEAFVQDPAYAPYAAARQAGSDSRFQSRSMIPTSRARSPT